jgi:hypothetical protein
MSIRFIRIGVMLAGVGFVLHAAHAQNRGITTQGAAGGLVVPSAQTLPSGDLAFTRSTYVEPNLGTFRKRQNNSVGIGLAPSIEIFGRFAEYQDPPPGQAILGARDISANIKFKLPEFWRGQPGIAVGLNDISGGASLFKSRYGVVSDQWGSVRWSAGYAWGSPSLGNSANGYAFDGLFGGVEWLVGQTGLSLLAEYDGQQKHVGAPLHISRHPLVV